MLFPNKSAVPIPRDSTIERVVSCLKRLRIDRRGRDSPLVIYKKLSDRRRPIAFNNLDIRSRGSFLRLGKDELRRSFVRELNG